MQRLNRSGGSLTRRAFVAAGGCSLIRQSAGQTNEFPVVKLTDPITNRSILHYQSPQHEVHHYYFISPWSPDGKTLIFFQFDRSVDKLTARGRFPGALLRMNTDGSGRRVVTPGLMGNYHTGVNQFWGPGNDSVYFSDTSLKPPRLAEVDLATGKVRHPETPVRCDRLSPKGDVLSCGDATQWGLFSRPKITTRGE